MQKKTWLGKCDMQRICTKIICKICKICEQKYDTSMQNDMHSPAGSVPTLLMSESGR
jgi:hypothetical protein